MSQGRPKKDEKLVALVVMVPAKVKAKLKMAADVQNMTMGAKAREILKWWYET